MAEATAKANRTPAKPKATKVTQPNRAAKRAKPAPPPHIGTLNEQALHASLKEWYAEPGDEFEVPVDGFAIDIVRGDLLIEIQTGGFSSIRRKLERLVETHPVRLVHPLPVEKWIVKRPRKKRGKETRRRSPKHCTPIDAFVELVRLPRLLKHPNFEFELLLTHEEEVRSYDGTRGWRKKGWVTDERRLIEVVGRERIVTVADALAYVPDDLEEPFDTAALGHAVDRPRWVAQKMAYCLRETGAIEISGKSGNALLYVRSGERKQNGRRQTRGRRKRSGKRKQGEKG